MENARSRNFLTLADGAGLLGAAVCALHCVAGPVLLVAGTTLPASFVTDEAFHELLLWAVLPAGALALGLGCWQHKHVWVLLLGILVLVGLSFSAATTHLVLGEAGERLLTLASAGP